MSVTEKPKPAPPKPASPKFPRAAPTYLLACERYGKIQSGTWLRAGLFCVLLPIDKELAAGWINTATGKPVTHIYCNKDMVPALTAALKNIKERGLVSQLKTFDGCFEIRDVRAEPGKPSWHSYALAIDINAFENRLNQKPNISPELVACFTDANFTWGGTFHRLDGMHFQFADG